MYQNKRMQKMKTCCKYQTLNPVFDENFSFTIPTNKLDDTQIVITVMDKDLIKWNEKIGTVILGKRAGQREMQHWREMLSKRRQPVTMWHYLKVDID
ncbi:synaptotagmin-7-like [Convolutriloba macropyga]